MPRPPVCWPLTPWHRLVLMGLCLMLLLASLPAAMEAAPTPTTVPATTIAEAPATAAPTISLGDVLRDDGTLRDLAGWEGTIDPAGYRLVSDPGQAPRFLPAAPAAGDEAWDSRFSLNGTGGIGNLRAVAYGDGKLFIGGTFNTVGGLTVNRIAMWNGTTWSPLGPGIPAGSSVDALVYGDGKLYVGGDFTTIGGTTVNRIAMWDIATSTWSPLGTAPNVGVDGSIQALAYGAGMLFVGGTFPSAAGGTLTVNNIAMWNPATNTWSALGTGANVGVTNNVNALAYGDGKLFVGGNFGTAANGTVIVNRVAMWDPVTNMWSALGTAPNVGVDSFVGDLVYGDGKLFVSGDFANAAGSSLPVNRVAMWDPATNMWSALGTAPNVGVNNTVNGLAYGSGKLFVGGIFSSAANSSLTVNRVAMWDPATNMWSALGDGAAVGVNNTVNGLAYGDGKLFVGGLFTFAGSFNANRIAQWNGSTWSPILNSATSGNGPNGVVNALAYGDGKLFVGGDFTAAGGVIVNRVARWDPATSTWSALGTAPNVGVNGVVNALAYGDGKLFVGGSFSNAAAASLPVNNIAVWNAATNTWSALGTAPDVGVDNTVNALDYGDGKLFVGGSFINAAGTSLPVNAVAVWTAATNTWSALTSGTNIGVDGSVYALSYEVGKLYVGGDFDLAALFPFGVNNVAMWDPAVNTWSALGSGLFDLGVNGPVFAISHGDGKIFVGGVFDSAAGSSLLVNNIAMWNPVAATWSALSLGGSVGVNGPVYALTYRGATIVAGGEFTVVADTIPANRIASWNVTTQAWDTFGSGLNGIVRALTTGSLWVGGDFTRAGNKPSFGLASWNAPLAATLATFEAQASAPDGIELAWETASELDNRGFHLYRAISPTAEPTRITSELIPSRVPGSAGGARYRWLDTDALPGTTYFYWLEDISLNGTPTRHGPVSAILAVPTALTLSTLTATGVSLTPLVPLALAGALLLAGTALRRRR